MRIEQQPGFVLHARPWRETSLLVEVLSRDHGRIGLVARGVHGPRKQPLRAALQPLQAIRFDAMQRGELAQLRSAEAVDAAPVLSATTALAGFYLNELVVRLAPRLDPLPAVFDAYALTRARLCAADAPLAWTLRRFERDLLDALGFGFTSGVDGDGHPLDPAARYELDAEHGPRRINLVRDGGGYRGATGRALLHWAADDQPGVEDLASLRHAIRPLLMQLLGGRGLRVWQLAGMEAALSKPA